MPYKGTGTFSDLNNHANQLNPNNFRFGSRSSNKGGCNFFSFIFFILISIIFFLFKLLGLIIIIIIKISITVLKFSFTAVSKFIVFGFKLAISFF